MELQKNLAEMFEIKTVEGQENVVMTCLVGQGTGIVEAEKLVNQYKAEGILAEKAKEMLAELPEIVAAFEAQVAKDQAEFKEQRDAILFEFREKLRSSLKPLVGPEELEKWVSFATDQTPGTNCKMDTTYFEYRNDPEKTAKLISFFKENE